MQGNRNVTLMVTNTAQLEAGLTSTQVFSTTGGNIGADPSCHWLLRDKPGDIGSFHCEIKYIDNQFCVLDSVGFTYVNGSTLPIGYGKAARLNEHDTLKIGSYDISVFFNQSNRQSMTTCSSITDMFVNEQTERLTGNDFGSSAPAAPRKQRLDDPLAALDAMEEGPGPIDLYGGFEIEPNAHNKTQAYLLAEDQQWLGRTIESKADSEQEVGSAIVLKPSVINYGEYTMDEDILTKIEHEAEQASDKALPNKHIATGHITAAPMMRGLGVNLSSNSEDMAQMQEISEEIGASLAASIQGLLSLHKEVEDSRFNLLNKNLQPIEDNPLRLGLNYESTVKTLLTAEKSPVHLSAPSAIAESLAAVSHHNQAVQVATLDALRHLLKAFSPEVLEKRFESYRRPHQQKSGGASSWVWTMYQSYYEELTSNRQNGFEKLFWEVFDQAYDKSIRLIAAKD